jgi:glycosyltransferase involved in cell wall biosynthesis
MLYIVNHYPTFSSNGYAIRSKAVAQALSAAGVSVVVAIRPGLPWDRRGFSSFLFASQQNHNGITVLHAREPSQLQLSEADYCDASQAVYREWIRRIRPRAVMAASNWQLAMPAALAAQEAGLPFFYEVRGFWELSKASQDPDWAASPAFEQAVAQETAVAQKAQRVFTLNGAMRDELTRRGIAAERIALVPNGISTPAPSTPLQTPPPQLHGRQVVGYVGSFNAYEGLAELLEAAARLVQRGVDLALLLVGGSHAMGLVGPGVSVPCPASDELCALATTLGIADRLVLPGRVPDDQVGAYYALMDVVVQPRRPLPVCELVSPMKPLEAVAHGKPVLVSSVAPLAELTSLGPALRCFEKGNLDALIDQLGQMLAEREQHPAWIAATDLSSFRWERCVQPIVAALQECNAAVADPSAARLIPAANAARQAGDLHRALQLYQQATAAQPQLASAYRFTIERLQQQLAESGQPLPPPTLSLLTARATAAAAQLPPLPPSAGPLVSVLMTAHNVAPYLEAAITSVLAQSWHQIQLIVVDDASTDGTWVLLQRLARSDGRLSIRRLNANLGTYYAKNLALSLAEGRFVFFQDGDDLSHPERLRLGMQQLLQPGVLAVQGAYARVEFPSTRVLPVNGLLHKLGLITLGLRREVFDAIGVFNCTTKASDDEFFQRLQSYAATGAGTIEALDIPTYYNTFRSGSLFADMVANDPAASGTIEQQPSPSRVAYVEAFRAKHAELGPTGFKGFFTFPTLRDHLPVAADMTLLPNPTDPVLLSLCSIAERAESLQQVLTALAPQVDRIHLYLDRYPEAPTFLEPWGSKLQVVLSQQQPGLRDNGKFLPLAQLGQSPCWLFTADDDIAYPPDYVAALLKRLEYYGRQAVLGVHGVLLPEHAEGYFSAHYRKVHLFSQGLEADALVNVLGTGTMACHSSVLQGLSLDHFQQPGMADLYLASWCHQRQIPLIAIARHDGWLEQLGDPESDSLWAEFHQADAQQAAIVRAHHPWGYSAIRGAIDAASSRTQTLDPESPVPERLEALMPLLWPCLR